MRLEAAKVDGANAWQRFFRITVPLMMPAILVAVLFRTLDAFRVFDAVFILTAGANDPESVSILGYNVLINRVNLGLGSAVSVLIFICVILIAFFFVKIGTSGAAEGPSDARPRAGPLVDRDPGGPALRADPGHLDRALAVAEAARSGRRRALHPVGLHADNYDTVFSTDTFNAALVNSIGIAAIAT